MWCIGGLWLLYCRGVLTNSVPLTPNWSTVTKVYPKGVEATGAETTIYEVIDLDGPSYRTTSLPPYLYGPSDFIDCDNCESSKLRQAVIS